MSQDNYGNEIPAAVQHTDEEYAYPPVGWKAVATERKICAQDERFASQNKAIGLLQCKLEQHIAQCADGLAPLADFISASWAVIDELVTRIEQLEAAQPIPTIARAATIDENGVLVSHDAWDVMHLELAKLEALRAKWNSVPWDDIQKVLWHMPNGVPFAPYKRIDQWRAEHAPKEAGE